jgi:uncharacterized protein (TIGR02118 family)
MIKLMFSWKDRPDRTPEECDAHYRAVHMNLATVAFEGVEGFHKLVYNRVQGHRVNDYNRPEARPAEPDFDAFVELWFQNPELLQQAMGRPPLDAMFEDHVNFMETDSPANIRIYDLDEEVILAAE